MASAPRMIFVLGTGHSGGTLFNLMLGASQSVFAAGESLHLWNLRNLHRESATVQAFWGQALPLLDAAGWPEDKLDRAHITKADIDLWHRWMEILSSLTTAPVIADKSNYLPVIRLLCREQLVEPFFVHLVRDPRAVAFSYLKKGQRDWQRTRSWQITNRRIAKFLSGRPDTVMLRYEDFVTDPWGHVMQILKQAGARFGLDLTSSIPGDIAGRGLDDPIFENLIFGGNRMRHADNRAGSIIHADTSYLDDMSAQDWLKTSFLCASGMRQFNYPLSRHAARQAFAGKLL